MYAPWKMQSVDNAYRTAFDPDILSANSRSRGHRSRRRRQLSLVIVAVLLSGACHSNGKAAAQRYTESGMRYFDKNKFEEAALQFRNALKRDPQSWEARYHLALAELKLRHWRDAYEDLQTVTQIQPSFAPARLELGELLLSGNKIDEARAQVDAVQSNDPQNVRAQALLARVYLMQKDYPRAVAEYEKAKQLDPRDPALWAACGLAKISAKQPEQAEKDFRRALELGPDSAENYRNLANALQLLAETKEIEPLLRRAVETHPSSLEMNLILADYYYRAGRIADAEQFLGSLKSRAAEFPDLLFELGDFWMWRNEVARAVTEYEAERTKNPSLYLEKKLVSAYLTLGRTADAERLNQAILKKDSGDLEGRTFDGALAYLHHDFSAASEKLQAVLKDDPKSLMADYYLGLTWIALNKPEQAKAAFSECVRLNDQFTQAYAKLGELALAEKDWGVAAEYAKRTLQLNPQWIEGYLLLGQAYMTKGDLTTAGRIVEYARKLGSPPAELYELAAQLAASKHSDAAANAQLDQALARTTQPLEVLRRFAEFQVELGHTNVAIDRIKRWMQTTPPQPGAYEMLAQLYLEQRDFDSATAAATKALELDKGSWRAHLWLGESYAKKGQLREALAQYDEAIRLGPAQVPPYVFAGYVAMDQGQYEKAKSYFEAAVRVDPDLPLAQQAMARWQAEEAADLNVALSTAQQLKKRFPDDPYVSDTLGWIYYQKATYPLALEQLRTAARALPENARVQYHLGMLYYQQGDSAQARRTLDRAIKLGLQPPALAATAQRTFGQLEAR